AARPLGPVPSDQPAPPHDDRRSQPSNRPSHPIDVILRSTPTGAEAAVDGIPLGPTPAYWNGTADGHEHEFTFVLPGHAVARYRFVPITSGVIHARLERIPSDEIDAGTPVADPTPGIPKLAPAPPVRVDAPAPIAPPPTVIAPSVDANEPSPGPGPQP
ncbi:MAG TPA: hypothetical protein VFQ65_31960, partial [Kofleriaceae bacterium]|nr:hypothetical protein [Kofleriaceae bacterium]